MATEQEHDNELIERVKEIYTNATGNSVESVIGNQQFEDATFLDLEFTDETVQEFLEAVNDEFELGLPVDSIDYDFDLGFDWRTSCIADLLNKLEEHENR